MQNTEYYKDIEIPSVNKENPRTSFVSHDDKDEAIIHITDFERSPYYINLNGKWEFYFNEDPNKVPKDIASNVNHNSSEWRSIEVPGNWEQQGYGTAIYTDGNYDFCPCNPEPPFLPPNNNPTGVYRRRDIEIPQSWLDQKRDIYLQVGGARGGLYVYVNGQEIGYNEDSKDPADFLLNKFIQTSQNNVITLLIHKYCTGSYLEDQDMWRLGGLERDVYLYSQPSVHITDFKVVTTFDDDYETGIFRLNTYLVNHSDEDEIDVKISYELIDVNAGKKVVLKGEKNSPIQKSSEIEISFDEARIEKVKKWSAEHPNLYILLLTLSKKSDSSVIEIVPFRVGFRREEIVNIQFEGNEVSVLLFNGKPIKFKGVNIHEHNEKTGHYVTDEIRLKDIELLKQNNFNALRFSHYPNCRRLYELCDEYGFYVYNECNIESHGMGFSFNKSLANKKIWENAHMERTKNMYERTKNYACVTFFSLGNEAGNGCNMYKTYEFLKENEKDQQNRPVVYECVKFKYNTDIHVPMYLCDDDFISFAEDFKDKPTIPCEYSHSMGNSNGNFNLIWSIIYKYPNLQGGFIWDWVDQGFLEIGKNGRKYWTFGGDYGDKCPSSGNHCINGCVSPDRTPHPSMSEIKYSHQNIGFEPVNIKEGIFKITNRFYFTDLSDYELICLIKMNEKVLKEINLTKNISSLKPQCSTEINLNSEIKDLKNLVNTEYFLNFRVFAKTNNQPFIPKGFIIAHDQFKLQIDPLPKTVQHQTGPALSISNEKDDLITISSEKVEFIFSKSEGIVKSFKVDDFQFISNGFGFQPNFWRGPTDNDYGNGAPKRERIWKKKSKKFTIIKCESAIKENKGNLTVIYQLKESSNFTVNYEVLPSGIVNISASYIYESDDELIESDRFTMNCIPRIGIRFRIPKELHKVFYFGRGPEENYCDRCNGTEIDLYKTTAEDLYFPYIRPQENGHHIDTKWMALLSDKTNGLLINASTKFEFNALRNPVEDFDDENQKNLKYQFHYFGWNEKAKNVLRRQHHIDDIVPHDYVEVNVDLMQEGVAGFNSWGDRPLEQFSIPENESQSYAFSLIPINNECEIPEKVNYIYD